MSKQHQRAQKPEPVNGGHALPEPAATWIGHKLNAGVDDIRVHTDTAANELAAQHAANAVTIGKHIHFAPGAFAPDRPEGLVRLLHESTHAVQQRGSGPPDETTSAHQEAEVDRLLATGRTGSLTTSGEGALREPTYPRRTTGGLLVREAERVLSLARDTSAADEQTRKWSNVGSNFGEKTAGSIARRIWTYIFLRHFTEPEVRATESAHPRYFYSRTYGWVDGQHFFGFIDYAQQATAGRTRAEAFDSATDRGFGIERNQQRVRDYVMLQRRGADDPTLRLMQVRPPNTPAFRAPVAVAGAVAREGALAYAALTLDGTEGELFSQLNGGQQDKFLNDSAMSAWTFEDPTSNQLGIRFYFQHGERINALAEAARETAFSAALRTFFSSIGVVEDQAELDTLAEHLPGRERYEAPHTTEDRERAAHPELYRLPP